MSHQDILRHNRLLIVGDANACLGMRSANVLHAWAVNEYGLRLIYATIETRETAEARTISPGGYELGTFTRTFQ